MAMEAQPVRVGQTACAHVCSPDHCPRFPSRGVFAPHTAKKFGLLSCQNVFDGVWGCA